MARNDKTAAKLTKLAKLVESLQGAGTLLITMQDNPDPDAIAAAVGLRALAHGVADVTCTLAHGGRVGRAENRALVQYLGLRLQDLSELDVSKFRRLAMVDTQPGTGNNSLPEGVVPDIVIDHHPIRRTTRSASYTDIRRKYGSTATIVWEYLRQAQIEIEIPVATALLYGVRSDTQDLGREASQADIQAMEDLYPLANKRMLSQIQRGRVPASYFQLLSDAIRNASVYDESIVSLLGEVDNPDMMGEVADLLLRHEKTNWTLCFGFYGGKGLLSVRSLDGVKPAGEVVHSIVRRIGTGGGHTNAAGGQIPLKEDTPDQRAKTETKVRRRFLKALEINARGKGAPLVRDRGPGI